MSKTIWMLDPGHGVDTKGKRSPSVPPGIMEWEFNRSIMRSIVDIAGGIGMDVRPLLDGDRSIPLADRIQRADIMTGSLSGETVMLISIHANASGAGGWSSARGSCVFIGKMAQEKAVGLAELLAPKLSDAIGTVDRGVKRKNLAMVYRPKAPAVLAECGFMTNLKEAQKLAEPSYREAIAQAFVSAMQEFEYVD